MAFNRERGQCDICKSKDSRIFYRSMTTMYDRFEKPLRQLERESWYCQRCGHYTIWEEGKELQNITRDN